MNLLTERSRIAWLAWKASVSENWRPGLDSPNGKRNSRSFWTRRKKLAWRAHIEDVVMHPPTGTINCLAVNAKGDISGTTTTSGLAWKIAGRVGDSPIIGAGLFVDNEVGAAGSTGRGEENIKIAGGHTIVEMMRKGSSPTDACMEALHRVARNYKAFPDRLKRFHIQFYALNKNGEYGAGSLWGKHKDGRPVQYAVHDGTKARLVPPRRCSMKRAIQTPRELLPHAREFCRVPTQNPSLINAHLCTSSVHEFRRENQLDAARFEPRNTFGERGDGRGARVADGDGESVARASRAARSSCLRIASRDASRRENFARRGGHAGAFGHVVGHGIRVGAAVNKEESALAQRGHQRLHQRGVGGGARALVVVHAGSVRNRFQHSCES